MNRFGDQTFLRIEVTVKNLSKSRTLGLTHGFPVTFSGIKRAFSSKKTDDDQIDDPHDFLIQEDGAVGEGKKLTDSFAEPLYKLVAGECFN